MDGFAGGGQYRDSITNELRPGSPLIALNSMAFAGEQAQSLRKNQFNLDVEYFFIEKNRDAFSYLQTTLRESDFKPMVGDKITLLQSNLQDQIDPIIAKIRARGGGERAIFLLDQFGFASVDFPMIRNILSLKNAEIILTFATDSLIDYLNEGPETQRRLSNVGLDLPSSEIINSKQHSQWRWLIQSKLHHDIYEKSGAKHYTPFFIRSKDAHRDFWLVHLSGHATARDVMVGLHWEQNTSFAHYGKAGLNMLGYDPDEDPLITGQRPLSNFYFDETAESLCVNSLLNELPDRIAEHKNGIDFDSFFSAWTNTAPATSQIFKLAIRQLVAFGVLKVTDKTGTIKRACVQRGSDVISRTRVKYLF